MYGDAMEAKVRSTCGICGCSPTTGDRIEFSHLVSETKRAKYEGAERLELEMPLCALCGTRAFKHLKRMFALQHFRIAERSRTR